MKGKRIIVIGGTACGPKAAARASRCDPKADITIVEQGPYVSSAICGLPYYVSGVINSMNDLFMRGTGFFEDVLNVEVLTVTRAERIDRKLHRVETTDVRTGEVATLEYDKLVLAPGSVPIVPNLEGVKLGGIFTLSGIKDANTIRKHLSGEVKKTAIIGAGLIGMEMAEALVSRGIEVTVIDMLDWALPALLDFEIAVYLEKHLKSQGVKLLFGQKVSGFEGDNGFVRRVITENGSLEADMVLLAIGRRPDIVLAREAGITIGLKGGVSVDSHLRTSDPDIYAGGDCVENINLVTGQSMLAQLGSTANKHGRIIGSNITGGGEEFPGILGTAIAKVFDYNVARTGLTERDARLQGYDVVTCLAPGQDHAGYYPGSRDIIIKLIAEKGSGKLLGGQAIGPGDTGKRIDVLATALSFGATADALANIDLAYAPPYNSALDPLHHASNVIRNKEAGMAEGLTPMAVKAKIDRGEDFILLDVRTKEEWESGHIAAPQVKFLPLDKLRERLAELPQDAEIITYCLASLRAYQAQCILRGAGFKNVKFLDGSIGAWPYETTAHSVLSD